MKNKHFLISYDTNKEEDKFVESVIDQLANIIISNVNFFKLSNSKKRTTERLLTIITLFFRDAFISVMTYSGNSDKNEGIEQLREIFSVLEKEIKKIMELNSKTENTI